MQFNFFDTHSHLNDPQFDGDRDAVIVRMKEQSIGALVVGTDRKMSEDAILLVEKHENLWATVGLHPTDNVNEVFDFDVYRTMAMHPKVVAIGECGLDYFHEEDSEKRDAQKDLFETQIHLAEDVGKPLMLHVRPSKGSREDAYLDTLDILEQFPNVTGNVHFFAGTPKVAKLFLARGFTLSFTGVVTFARDYDEVIKTAPQERLLSETDCPYVAPVPFRGARNEPVYIKEIVAKMAEIRGESLETVSTATVANALRVWGIGQELPAER